MMMATQNSWGFRGISPRTWNIPRTLPMKLNETLPMKQQAVALPGRERISSNSNCDFMMSSLCFLVQKYTSKTNKCTGDFYTYSPISCNFQDGWMVMDGHIIIYARMCENV